MVIVREIQCRSILSNCGITGITFSVNPYTGCQHGCVYCYARFMLRYRPHPEDWGSFVDVKANAPEILRQQLKRKKPALVLLSSVTDPYQPVEAKYSVTRGCLLRLLEADFPISVLTKSALVSRDIDLFQRFTSCEVGLTITTLDENLRSVLEPVTSKSENRLEALEKLRDAGIPTYAFIGPILPILGETTLGNLITELRRVGVGRVLVDRLNIKAGNWATIEDALARNYPNHLPPIRDALSSGSNYYERLKERVSSLLTENGLQFSFCY
jgi:DNA repair photolyase